MSEEPKRLALVRNTEERERTLHFALDPIPGLPDGEYDQEVAVHVDGLEHFHTMKVTYENGRPTGYRNPWTGAFVRFAR
jgi:hypothetical protein